MVIDHKSQMSRERNQEVAVYWRREGGSTDYCGIQERAHLPHFSVCIREAGDSVTITSSNSTAHNCQQTLNQIQHEKKIVVCYLAAEICHLQTQNGIS